MDHEAQVLACKKIHEKADVFRGRLLNRTAVIDSNISAILTALFPEDQKKRPFVKKSLEKKRQLLFEKIQTDHPSYWNGNKEHLEPLEEIIKFRNKLAHSVLDVSELALKRPISDGVGFLDWNKGKPVTDHCFNEVIVRTTMIIGCLSDISRLIPYVEKPLQA